jgi:iron(III) transport system substrate-binding protein
MHRIVNRFGLQKLLFRFCFFALLLSLSFQLESLSAQQSGQVIIYSGRREPLIVPVIELFKKQTNIQVTLKSGEDQALANLILQEQPNPIGDLFITVDSGLLEFLRLKGALQPYTSSQIVKIPRQFRSIDSTWVGASGRGRVIIYNTNLVKASQLPKSVFELTDPKWKGKIAMDSFRRESTLAWVTALRLVKGDSFTRDFLRRLQENEVQFLNGGTEVRRAVGRGQVSLGLVNHYYFYLEIEENRSPIGIIFPDQGAMEMGILVNAAGAGIMKGAKHTREAENFLNFLASPPAQELFARLNFEWPLLPGIGTAASVRPMESIKAMGVSLSIIGKELQNTLDFLDISGF